MSRSYTYTYELALHVSVDAASMTEAEVQLDLAINAIDEVISTPGFETKLCSILDDKGAVIYESSIDFIPISIEAQE